MQVTEIFALESMESGAIRRAREVAAIARAAGIVVHGGGTIETGITNAAGARLMTATPAPKLGCEFCMPTCYRREDILAEPFPIRDGKACVPECRGPGTDVDRERLPRYTMESFVGGIAFAATTDSARG